MTSNARRFTAICLATTAVLSTVSTLTEPDLTGDYSDWLAAIADAGGRARLSALAFVLAQLPFIVGMAGLARWLQPSRLATVGGALAVVGGFGHAVYGGVILSQTVMAADAGNASVYAGLMDDMEGAGVLIPFMAAGLLGTVVGMLLLAIAWWRSRTEPRWVAPLLGAFLLVEFVGGSLSDWSRYLATLLYLAALVTIAVRMSTRAGLEFEPAAPRPAARRTT